MQSITRKSFIVFNSFFYRYQMHLLCQVFVLRFTIATNTQIYDKGASSVKIFTLIHCCLALYILDCRRDNLILMEIKPEA
jgi:hypothetical protein